MDSDEKYPAGLIQDISNLYAHAETFAVAGDAFDELCSVTCDSFDEEKLLEFASITQIEAYWQAWSMLSQRVKRIESIIFFIDMIVVINNRFRKNAFSWEVLQEFHKAKIELLKISQSLSQRNLEESLYSVLIDLTIACRRISESLRLCAMELREETSVPSAYIEELMHFPQVTDVMVGKEGISFEYADDSQRIITPREIVPEEEMQKYKKSLSVLSSPLKQSWKDIFNVQMAISFVFSLGIFGLGILFYSFTWAALFFMCAIIGGFILFQGIVSFVERLVKFIKLWKRGRE